MFLLMNILNYLILHGLRFKAHLSTFLKIDSSVIKQPFPFQTHSIKALINHLSALPNFPFPLCSNFKIRY